jgi:hypothetical protein
MHAVTRDRVTGSQMKDTTEVVRRDRQLVRQPRQRAAGLRRQRFTGAVDDEAASASRRGSSGSDAARIDLLESLTDEHERAFDELVSIAAFAACGEKEPVSEVEPWRDRDGT